MGSLATDVQSLILGISLIGVNTTMIREGRESTVLTITSPTRANDQRPEGFHIILSIQVRNTCKAMLSALLCLIWHRLRRMPENLRAFAVDAGHLPVIMMASE
jgi:hypothetical protein